MNTDISELLNSWEYDPENNIRILKLDSEREVLQVRQPLGIEQYELDGRPDGKTLYESGTVLDECRRKMISHKDKYKTVDGFRLNHSDFKDLRSEGILYYHRYLLLFQLGEFERTARDTEHNLKIFEMVEKFRFNKKDRQEMLQYRPYVLRVNAIANAMLSLQSKLKTVAKKILESAMDMIRTIPEIDTPEFKFEKTRSLNYLKSTLDQIKDEDLTYLEKLEQELEEAVTVEDYERAAELRDRIFESHQVSEKKAVRHARVPRKIDT